MKKSKKLSRRNFIEKTAVASASITAFPAILSASKGKIISPNDKINFGVIGCNGMGNTDTRSFLRQYGVDCIAVCDVDDAVIDKRSKEVGEAQGMMPKTYKDYREVLANKDIDFVVIGTPDHWHCKIAVDALEADKHVYLEKPLANSIQECDILLNAAKAHDKIFQMGQWQRSGPHWRNAIDFVHSGKLGNIRTVKAWAYQGWMKPVPHLADGPAPAGVDYDMWLGPMQKRAFNKNRFHFDFRWFWDYAGGLQTDWGVHVIDYALFGMKATTPKSVMAVGGKMAYPDDASETPDTLQTIYDFGDFTMLWEHATGIDLGPYQTTHGVAFIGNNGTLVVNRDSWYVIPEDEYVEGGPPKLLMEVPEGEKQQGNDVDRHTKNYMACLWGEETPNAGIEVGHAAATVAHMGNVAWKAGKKINWDADRNRFVDDDVHKLTQVKYQNGWKLPKY